MNKLPEKLVLLRKHANLSQGDIASRLNVPVTEYMQWENGNSICSVVLLKRMADMFGITVDDLVDNTKSIVIPEPVIEQSATIPFNGGQDINATQMYDGSLQDTMQTQQFSSLNDQNDQDDDGHTRVMNTSDLSNVEEKNTSHSYDEEDEEEEVKPKKKKKSASPIKKKQTMIIIGAVAAIVVVIAVVLLLFNKSGSSLNVGNDNRIALGNTYSLYVDNQGNIKKYGNFSSTENFSTGVQVAAFDDHAAVLLKNGTVISSDGNADVKEWKHIKYIAAGKDHTVGVTDEGTVVCAGNESACKVSEWKNISSVYAGNGFTLGLTNDGAIKASGSNTDAVSNQSNVRHISVSDNLIALTKKDGKVTIYPIGSAESLDTGSWTDIQSTAVGNNLAVGLKKDGKVNISYSDEEVVNKVTSWKSIKHVAANGSTVIGIDSYGKMHGAGDNTYNQYVDTTEDDTNKQEETLGEVKNIQVDVTTANVVIKWDTVENASYYEVSVNTDPESKTKTSSNSTSIATSSLTDGQSYTVTVVAKSDDDKVKESSATHTFTYTAKTVQLATPSGITASTTDDGSWLIQWTAVEHATSYKLSIDGGQEFEVTGTSYTNTGIDAEGYHMISVKACSNEPTYTESEAGTQNLEYRLLEKKISISYFNGNERVAGPVDVTVKVGLTYSNAQLDLLVNRNGYIGSQGYQISNNEDHLITADKGSYDIQVTPTNAPVEGQQ